MANVYLKLASKAHDVRLRVSDQTATVGMKLSGGAPTGTAQTARRLATPRRIALGGDVTGSALFDGSADVTIPSALHTLTNMDLEAMLK